MTAGATSTPSAAIPAAEWAAADRSVVDTLGDLIRIPSVNPPDPAAPDQETRVARYLAGRLRALGLRAEVVEPVPGRGSVHARLRGDGTGGEPFLLLSHLDVVPVPGVSASTARTRAPVRAAKNVADAPTSPSPTTARS